jgi:hypothetical protein
MTTKTNKAVKTIHPWSSKSLLAKAQRYSQEMLTHSRDDWHFGLASTFVLEFLARAALANISPALLADAKSWNNLYFSLGYTPKTPKFIPKSIDISEVFSRLRETLSEFTSEFEGFSAQHINRRNEELHTGSTPFDGLNTSWLPRFYQTLDILLTSMNEDLSNLIGIKESEVARQMMTAAKDESAKAVAKTISAHQTVWESKEAAEKTKLTRQASTWATRQTGHRVICPACNNDALVVGEAISEPIRRLDGDLIIESQEYLPVKFECIACQLKIAGLSQLNACNLGATYKSTSTYDAAEYYAPEDEHPGFDDDNNEY